MSEKDKNSEQRISPHFLVYFIVFLLFMGMIILYASNSLTSPTVVEVRNDNSSIENKNSADLSAMNDIRLLEKKVGENPNDLNSLLHLSHLLNDSGFYEKAIVNYKKYLLKEPKNVDVIVDMGVCYFQLNKLDDAINTMLHGLEYEPNHQIANFNLGIIYSAKRDHDNSLKYWEIAYKLNPNSDIGIKAKNLIDNH